MPAREFTASKWETGTRRSRPAIRSYNAHLSRVQVTTYSELLDSADRALRFEIQH
jgi:hypothetical protein